MPDDDTFLLFRGAKLRLDAIDPAVVHAAAQPGKRLVGRLGLTDAKGHPRCASVHPPEIAWPQSRSTRDRAAEEEGACLRTARLRLPRTGGLSVGVR
jgi:hypothetical protein